MSPSRRAATAVIALVAILGAACSSATPSPSVSESAEGEPEPSLELVVGPFTSEPLGWSAELLPPEWRYRPATEEWPPHTNPLPGAAYTDNFERPDEPFPVFDVSTQELPADQTQEEFLADITEFNEDFGCAVEGEEEITVDGAIGRLQTQTCASGRERVWEVIVFDGSQVYAIYWLGLLEDAAVDEPVFRGVMETFAFAGS